MKAKSISKHIKQSPYKVRKTLDSVRGKKVSVALDMLHFSPEKASVFIEKTIKSAVANFNQLSDGNDTDVDSLKIKEAFVNGGPVMKRFRAASMGRASKLRRPTSHLTIVVSDN